jgi:hypothetical protein
MRWRFRPAALGLLLPALLACGCESLSPTENGLLAGSAVGAGTGAVVGSAVGRPLLGAAIGTGVGAVAGGLAGNGVERAEKRQEAQAAALAQQRALQLTDVVTLTQQHVGDEVIINQIRTSGSIYNLSANDILWLRQNGVHEPVIMEMQATAARYPRVYSPQPYYPGAVYVMEPAPPPPPPPPAVGVGIGFSGRWH